MIRTTFMMKKIFAAVQSVGTAWKLNYQKMIRTYTENYEIYSLSVNYPSGTHVPANNLTEKEVQP